MFAINSEGSVKKSLWSMRRAIVVQEAVAIRAIAARKVDTLRNLADVFTKYIKFDRWRRFMDELLNIAHRAAPLPLDHVFASA